MNGLNYSISVKTTDFHGQSIRVIDLKVFLTSSRFRTSSLPLTVSVTDGVSTVKSWQLGFSGNLKEIDAWFTTDAFLNMGNRVKITLSLYGEIQNVNISDFINLPPNTDPDSVDADNAWLQNILDTQDS